MDTNTEKQLHEVFDEPKFKMCKSSGPSRVALYAFDQKIALDVCNIFISKGHRSLCMKSRKKLNDKKFYQVITTAPETDESWAIAREYLNDRGLLDVKDPEKVQAASDTIAPLTEDEKVDRAIAGLNKVEEAK